MFDYVIVGAGLTGLWLAHQMRLMNSHLKIRLIEKSKGSGGRMATRRIGEAKFDHGAQFIKKRDVTNALIQFCHEKNILRPFPAPDFEAYCGQQGMTQIAKALASDLNVTYNCKLQSLTKSEDWCLMTDIGEQIRAKNVILTSPLPQSIEILRQSEIAYDIRLDDIHYSKALVFMFECRFEPSQYALYTENVGADFFSISSQKAKGLVKHPAFTVVMSADWSEKHFANSDQQIVDQARPLIDNLFLDSDVQTLHLKKWRYCKPYKFWEKPFYNSEQGLYLAGDAFGGSSLTGSFKSAEALYQHLKIGSAHGSR